MPVRTTFDMPTELHSQLRLRAQRSKTSMRKLILEAVEEKFGRPRGKRLLTGPLLKGKGPGGPRFPVDETPYDLLLP
jgi:hypothetical protein